MEGTQLAKVFVSYKPGTGFPVVAQYAEADREAMRGDPLNHFAFRYSLGLNPVSFLNKREK